MSEQVKPIHRQLLDIGHQAFYHPEDGYTGQLRWQSRSDWDPQLIITKTEWSDQDGQRTLAKAAFVTRVEGDDSELHVDGAVTDDYLNDAYGHYFLEEFQKYFADPANLAISGLVVATRPELIIINAGAGESFTSTAIEMEIFQAANV